MIGDWLYTMDDLIIMDDALIVWVDNDRSMIDWRLIDDR
jgi:hypothetical protein